MLSEGSSRLIDAFATNAGIVIVLANEVKLVNRQGALIVSRPWAREVTAATFDGTRLVVADRALFLTFDAQLQPIGGGKLAWPCQAATALDGGRFLCGRLGVSDRAIVTYDAQAGTQLGAFASEFGFGRLEGLDFRRLTGTNDVFATSQNQTPVSFHLYRVLPSNEPIHLSETTYYDGVSTTINPVAFLGAPAERVVSTNGSIFKFTGAACQPSTPFPPSCFLPDGKLQGLYPSERFVELTDEAGGFFVGLSASPPNVSSSRVCDPSCNVVLADVASQAVAVRTEYDMPAAHIITARRDDVSSSLLVGYSRPVDTWPPVPLGSGHVAELLPYEAPGGRRAK